MVLHNLDQEITTKALTAEMVREFIQKSPNFNEISFDLDFVVNAVQMYRARGVVEGTLVLHMLQEIQKQPTTTTTAAATTTRCGGLRSSDVETESELNMRAWLAAKQIRHPPVSQGRCRCYVLSGWVE